MLVCMRRSFNLPSLTLIACIFVGLIIMAKHVKDLYEHNKKMHRFQNYNIFLDEVSESITNLESDSNRSYRALHKLQSVIEKNSLIK